MANEWKIEPTDDPQRPWRVAGTGLWRNPKTGLPVRRWAFAYKTEDAAKAGLELMPVQYKLYEVDGG